MATDLRLQFNSVNLVEKHFRFVLLAVMCGYESKPAIRVEIVQTHFKEAMIIVWDFTSVDTEVLTREQLLKLDCLSILNFLSRLLLNVKTIS